MHAAIPGTILERVVSQNGTIPGLRMLVDEPAVDDFVKYYKDVKPLLDAHNGMEVISFLLFQREGGPGKCAGYKASLPEVRNYHRFTVPQLDALAANRVAAATNKAQVAPLPVCVVLQTAMDHNGAFHRDDHMTDVINRVTHLTLVAEGKPSLAEFSAELAKFAAFGRGDKVDEVMVSGHGNAKLMELAGDKDVGNLKSTGEEIYYNSKNERVTVDQDPRYTSDAHRAATDDFIASIKDVLRDDAASRVVLNACLTASNSVDGIVLSANPDTTAKQVRDAIAKDPSLATAMKTKMGAHQGQVRGSNASFGREATLVNGAGNIDIDSATDPKLTSSKLEYTEAGTEPTGALRATLESWGTDRVATLAAVNRRIVAKGGDTSWREKVIIAAMKIIAANPDDAALISKLIASVGALSHLTGRPDCKVSALKNQVPDAHLDAIFTDLTTSVTWTSAAHNYVPAVVFQVWIEKNHAKIGDFLTFLDASSFTTQNARAFFDLGHLAPLLPQLLVAPSATPPRGSFLIALLYLANQEDGAPAAAKKYIKDVVGVGNQIFPGTSNVDAILTSASPQSVLEDAGVVPKAGVPVLAPLGMVAPLGPTPNLDPSHSGNNTLAVDSLSMSCTTHGLTATNAYMLPAGNKIGDIPSGTSLNIIGKTRGMKKGFFSDSPNTEFFAVERTIGTNQTVFVAVADVRVT